MIENFEERYAKLLSGVQRNPVLCCRPLKVEVVIYVSLKKLSPQRMIFNVRRMLLS